MTRQRRLRNVRGVAALLGMLGCQTHAQPALPEFTSARSASGQFLVTGKPQMSRLATTPAVATNADFVRLDPALLAVSAERIKVSLWRVLGIGRQWRGTISLALYPAQSPGEQVTIVSEHSNKGWNYRVALPDVLPRVGFARAMTGVMLLEFANRTAGARTAEIPLWLTDGLSQQLLAPGTGDAFLSLPNRDASGLALSRAVTNQRGLDPLADARRVLREHPALTFEQLCWPTGPQLAGDDDGVYRASAQLFVNELLELREGPDRLRAMLQMLPRYYNWQTAFQAAFDADFPRPLNVEKWWALQVVGFVAREPGPTWTPEFSSDRLTEILRVPVDVRLASDNLPVHSGVTLQAVIADWDFTRQEPVLQTCLRDLQLAQLRLAPPFAALTAEYRRVLDSYLSQRHGVPPPPPPGNMHPRVAPLKILVRDTLKQLDALDSRRQAALAASSAPRVKPVAAPKRPSP